MKFKLMKENSEKKNFNHFSSVERKRLLEERFGIRGRYSGVSRGGSESERPGRLEVAEAPAMKVHPVRKSTQGAELEELRS